MNEKCTKFENLYVFGQEKELEEHIKNCPVCQAEMQKLERVSDLLQEAKPYYARQQKLSYVRMKVACVLCLGLFVSTLIGYFVQYNYFTASADNTYSEYTATQSTNEYGIPVDSYGLITVN